MNTCKRLEFIGGSWPMQECGKPAVVEFHYRFVDPSPADGHGIRVGYTPLCAEHYDPDSPQAPDNQVPPEERWVAVGFRTIVRDWVQALDTHRRDLAQEFEVPQSTVERWWIGTATPHPRLQAQIIAWIRAQA